MTVKNKIILTVSLVILLSLGSHQILGYFYVLPLLETLEVDDGKKDLKRALLAVNRDLDHLSMFCHDWAEWDDSYRFVKDRNQEFIESNLLENTFLHNHLAMLFFIDKSGRVVWGRCYSGELEEFISIADFPETSWPQNHPLLQHRRNDSFIKGYLKSAEGAMMLASRPIVPSDGVGEILGFLVMGRLLCDRCVEMMRERTQVDMDLWSMDCDTLPQRDCQAKANLSAQKPSFFDRDDDWLYGYSYLTDIYNKPAILLRTKAWRSVYKRCWDGVMVDMIAALCVSLVVVFLISFLLHRLVSWPLVRFSRSMAAIKSSGELQELDVHSSDDEIGYLQLEFNQMMRRLHEESAKTKSIEMDLRLSQASLKAVLEAAPDGILTIDDSGIIKSANPAAALMFGYELESLPGKSVMSLADPQQQTLLREEVLKLREDPASSVFSFGVEVSGLRRDGSHILVHCKVGQVEGEADLRFICIIRDVSGLKDIHERLTRTKHLASIGEMGASIAHEIRNPLAGISGAVQVLTEMSSPESADYEVLKEVSRLTGRIEDTVVQMLEYAKDWQPEPKLCRIVGLINDKVEEFRRQTEISDVVIKVEGGTDIRALIDPELIGQVMVNLMANAVAACAGKPGRLLWQVTKTLREVSIVLQDNGCGIDEDVLKNVFKPFFTTKVSGNGLGLAICQKIVERHNGKIAIESKVGVGSKVTIVLPKSKFLKA